MAKESNERGSIPRIVAVSSPKPFTGGARAPIGIVADDPGPMRTGLAPRLIGLDLTFPPIGKCPSTVVTSHSGTVGSGNPIQLLFWGSIWQSLPDPNNKTQLLANSFIAAVKSILAGPWMSGLRQYGVRRSPFGGASTITSPDPPFAPATFSEQAIQVIIQSLIDQGTFPEPDESGGPNLYIVVMPPNTQYSPGGARGAHSFFNTGSPIDVDNAWYAWIGSQSLNRMTSTFCHELAEMTTDPELDNWLINGSSTGCNEIGDVCNLQDGPLNGVNVESYWSIFDNACLIPTAWSLRRTLAGAGKKLAGKGLLSLQNPIPSLNQFVVNL